MSSAIDVAVDALERLEDCGVVAPHGNDVLVVRKEPHIHDVRAVARMCPRWSRMHHAGAVEEADCAKEGIVFMEVMDAPYK